MRCTFISDFLETLFEVNQPTFDNETFMLNLSITIKIGSDLGRTQLEVNQSVVSELNMYSFIV